MRDALGAALVQNGGDGCIAGCISDCSAGCDCFACDGCACDCASCEGCDCQPIPGGFAAAHPGARIANAAQVRVTDHAMNFVGTNIPTLIGAVPGLPLPYFPIDIDGDMVDDPVGVIQLVLSNTDVLAPSVATCKGNYANGLGANHPCVRVKMDISYRTCAYDTDPTMGPTQAQLCADGPDPVTITVNAAPLGNVSCVVTASSDGVNPDQFGALQIEADVAVINEALLPNQGYSRLAVLDAELVNNESLEPYDVTVACSSIEGTVNPTIVTSNLSGCSAIADRQTGCTVGTDEGCAPFHNNQTCRVCGGVLGQIGMTCPDGWKPCAPCDFQELVWVVIRDLGPEDDDDGMMGNELGAETADDIDDLIDDVLDDLLQQHETILDDGVLCMSVAAAGDCPTGTTYVTDRKTCTIDASPGADAESKTCIGPVLGLQNRINLGTLLAGIAPGMTALVDFVFALGGDGVTPASLDGHNLNLFGGLENLSHDNCVPRLSPGNPGYLANPMATIPQVAAFQNSTRPGTGTPFDVGVAVSEEFANYALFKIWDSGLLCLTVTSGLSDQLSPSMFGPLLFGNTIDRFLFPLGAANSYLGLSLRPQQPPFATTENIPDPNEAGDQVMEVAITLPSLEIDFIFWTNDRFTRLTTIHTDLTVALQIDITPNGANDELVLKLGRIAFENTSYTNSTTLLTEEEIGSDIGGTLNSVAPLIASGLAGAIPPIALEALINNALVLPGVGPLPLRIDFTADSLLPFDDGAHPFFGIFLNLGAAAPGAQALTTRADTTVEVTSVTMPEDRTAFAAATLGQGPLPRVEIAMDAQGPEGVTYEYAYRTTFSTWSAWSQSKYAVIEDPSLVLQQHQQVFARARIAGTENTTDYSSATAEFTVDVTEPAVQVTIAPNGEGELQAYDFVYGTDLEYRVDGGAWKDLGNGTVGLGPVTNATVIEVRDGSGNVGSNNKLRGRTDPDAAVGGCGCATAGSTSDSSAPAAMLSLAMLGLVVARRRKR